MITYGFEAEFLNLDKDGHIQNLAGRILSREDEVGVDGHEETIEIRTIPTVSIREQLEQIEGSVRKYYLLLKQAKSKTLVSGTIIRGGAYYSTPLSIHLHFGGFDPRKICYLIDLLHLLLRENFIEKIENANEARTRAETGYGRSGLGQAIRVKGNNWWEWREPSSVFSPACVKVLLGLGQALAQLVYTIPTRKEGHALVTLAKNSAKLADFFQQKETRIRSEFPAMELAALGDAVAQYGELNWDKDLLPTWLTLQTGGENKA